LLQLFFVAKKVKVGAENVCVIVVSAKATTRMMLDRVDECVDLASILFVFFVVCLTVFC